MKRYLIRQRGTEEIQQVRKLVVALPEHVDVRNLDEADLNALADVKGVQWEFEDSYDLTLDGYDGKRTGSQL